MKFHPSAIFLLALGPPVVGQQLLVPSPLASEVSPPTVESHLRTRAIGLAHDELREFGTRALEPGRTWSIELFADTRVEVAVRRLERTSASGFTATGSIVGDPLGSFSLAYRARVLSANFRTGDGRVHGVRYLKDGLHYVAEYATDGFPPCGLGSTAQVVPQPPQSPPPPGKSIAGTNARLDVLVLFTKAVSDAQGGPLAVATSIEMAMAEGDQAFFDSSTDVDLNLVGMAQVDYDEPADMADMLGDLTVPVDGQLDEAHRWRAVAGADMVALLVENDEFCGMAWLYLGGLPWAGPFSVTNANCAFTNLSLAHELGHNIGCQHDIANAFPAVHPFGFGYNFTGATGDPWRTIMAYGAGVRIPRYSNPFVFFDGAATGVFQFPLETMPANNAQLIDGYSPDVEDFQPTQPKLTPVYVDADVLVPGNGSLLLPYGTLEEALLRVAPGGRIVQTGSDADGYAGPTAWFTHCSVELDPGAGALTVGS